MSDRAATQLQALINRSIPLSEAMGYEIRALDARAITVEAPLAPNINIHGTGFAGSQYALGILAAWGLCAHMIALAGLDAELVVVEANIRYRLPVTGDIVCHCAVTESARRTFIDELTRKGRSRLNLRVEIGANPAAVIDATMHARLR